MNNNKKITPKSLYSCKNKFQHVFFFPEASKTRCIPAKRRKRKDDCMNVNATTDKKKNYNEYMNKQMKKKKERNDFFVLQKKY